MQLLPRGEFDLVLFWLASRRGLLRGKVEEGKLFAKEFSVEEKVKILVLERLRMNADVKGVWQDVRCPLPPCLPSFPTFFLFLSLVLIADCSLSQALAQMSLLGNIPISLLELHALSNDMLNLAGDTAVDASWYARRMALGAIYASAEVVMTRDPSPDLVETEAFVQRRFEDKEILKEKVEGVASWVGFWGNTAVGIGRSCGLKI